MSDARDGFDAIGVVVDWIDACKLRRLDDLLDLYDVAATIECCEGGSFRGRSEMERYWRPRLARAVTGAFEIDALFPEADGVTLDYRGYDGVPVRTHFRFTSTGRSASPPARLSERPPKGVGREEKEGRSPLSRVPTIYEIMVRARDCRWMCLLTSPSVEAANGGRLTLGRGL